jgi:hypothetical protein
MAARHAATAQAVIGKTFGRLTAVRVGELEGTHRLIECKCICGGKKNVRVNSLKSGQVQSCGCLQREVHQATAKRTGRANRGARKTSEHLMRGGNAGSEPDSSLRALTILRDLTRSWQRVKPLADKYGVDQKTIRRDLSVIRKAGWPVLVRIERWNRKAYRVR